tara:strand:+ start:87 stop:314 length:228 start_codon:yes stop_codon:yes gene_type:complete
MMPKYKVTRTNGKHVYIEAKDCSEAYNIACVEFSNEDTFDIQRWDEETKGRLYRATSYVRHDDIMVCRFEDLKEK